MKPEKPLDYFEETVKELLQGHTVWTCACGVGILAPSPEDPSQKAEWLRFVKAHARPGCEVKVS